MLYLKVQNISVSMKTILKKIIFFPLFLISILLIALAFLIDYLHSVTGETLTAILSGFAAFLMLIFSVLNGIKLKFYLYEKNYLTGKKTTIIGLLLLLGALLTSPLVVDEPTFLSYTMMCLLLFLTAFFTPVIIMYYYLILGIVYTYISQPYNIFVQIIFTVIVIWLLSLITKAIVFYLNGEDES